MSKAIFLKNTLVALLQEVGLLSSEIPWDKPVAFQPFRVVRNEQRIRYLQLQNRNFQRLTFRFRLSAYLYKIDSYIGLLRVQRGLLTPEELHFPLPSTFSLYNSDGPDVCQARKVIEPPIRAQKTLQDLTQDISLRSPNPIDGLMLVEDIQLGLCAMRSSIWQEAENLRQDIDGFNAIERDVLGRRLDVWKRWLVQLPFGQSEHLNFSQEQHVAMRFYYGIEDQAENDWQSTVYARPAGLYFDTLMLYHLLSLHLNADIRVFRQLTRDLSSGDLLSVYGQQYEQNRSRREVATQEWAQTYYARRALCHATSVLVNNNNLADPEKKMVDPVAFMALSTGALVIWAYCMFGQHSCRTCASNTQNIASEEVLVDLSKWSVFPDKEMLHNEQEAWIKMGGGRASLFGVQLCRCHVKYVAEEFRKCLPGDWELLKFSLR